MRKTLIFIIFNYSLFAISQNSLSIDFNLCKTKENESVYNNEYKIICNDSIITEFKNFTSSHNLADGKYRVEYQTYFGWKTTESFLLFEETSYYLNFCIDEINTKPIDIYNLGIDSIKDGETLEITHNYSGCFNSGGEKIIITRIKNKYFLNYNNLKRKLKNREIKFLKAYEIELINLNTNEPFTICTAFSQNIIQYGAHKFEYSESCPKWSGFNDLKNKLKLK
ncbi:MULTISPECIES: hypothetical protein [Flavobacterium]|uniref:Uncharacterized protein n=1 Tax=Flavobacterium jumunjinense TaxID=998845 RepID=A0ABV5GM10_9FLAO|nr:MULTISPECIES: hypothetical protein [Flavobacterium]